MFSDRSDCRNIALYSKKILIDMDHCSVPLWYMSFFVGFFYKLCKHFLSVIIIQCVHACGIKITSS